MEVMPDLHREHEVPEIGMRTALPDRFLLEGPPIEATIKARPEDFIVDEIPLYEPTGEGEHLFMRVQKIGMSHGEMVLALARHFGVRENQIGFAGMKDKDAVTSQTVSLQTPNDAAPGTVIGEGATVVWTARSRAKLRRGHLAGNRFSIRIRDLDPLKAPVVSRRLNELAARGVPNFFGPQRFGHRINNHLVGAFLLQQNWQAALDELLGSRGSAFPESQRERRELYDAGMFADALRRWPNRDVAERNALRALARGDDAYYSCCAMDFHMMLYVSAAQSALFNWLLNARLDEGALEWLQIGDLAWVHQSRAVFAVDEGELANPDLTPRIKALELSPSGPMWGPRMTRAAGEIAVAEERVLRDLGVSINNFDGWRFRGERRSMRCRVRNHSIDGGFDEHGPFVRVAFDLDRGAYATIVLRELLMGGMKPASDEGIDDS